MIARIWHGKTKANDAAAYLAYLFKSGIPAYRATSGNKGAWVLRRIDNDLAHFITLSFWESRTTLAGHRPVTRNAQVKYTDSTGAPFLETFDMWHSDGTEWETANGSPILGNNCLGVWKQIGPRTVQLNHIGWNFNPDGCSGAVLPATDRCERDTKPTCNSISATAPSRARSYTGEPHLGE